MAKVLVISNSPSISREIENSFLEHSLDYQIAKGAFEFSDFLRLQLSEENKEDYTPEKFDLILLDSGIFVSKSAHDWLEYFYETVESLEEELKIDLELDDLPVLLMDTKTDFNYIDMVLKQGYKDYILSKPLDSLILIQKIQLLLSENRSTPSLVNEIVTDEEAFLSLKFKVAKLSIFGIQLIAYQPVKIDAVLNIDLDFLLPQTVDDDEDNKDQSANSLSQIVCRCYKTEKHPTEAKAYVVSLQFLALGDQSRKLIRSWMNQEYAKEKIKTLEDETA